MSRPGPILVFSPYTHDLPRFQALLRAALPDVALHVAASVADAAPHLAKTQILYGWGFGAETLRRMPALRWVQKMGAGVDDIVGDWPCGDNVILTRTDGRLIAPRMVEYVVGAILDKTARFDLARKQQATRVWEHYDLRSITDMTIGVAGLGEIGSAVARTLGLLGANVIGWRRSRVDTPVVSKLFVGNAELGDFVSACDAVVLVLPMTNETTSLFDAEIFRRIKRGAHFINVGRGGSVVEAELLRAIDDGRISHATLDVFAVEPLPREHPFWLHPNVRISPHCCGPLLPDKVVPHFLGNYAAFAEGRPMLNVIDVKRQY